MEELSDGKPVMPNSVHPLQHTDHRPWPLPSQPWVMAQRWHDLLFAHWPIPAAQMAPLLPPGLPLDTWEGEAWVGVVPFRMSGVRPRLLPAVPGLSAFPELNLRTYVNLGGKPGVWFFSLDAANPIAVAIARALYRLPYFRAQMTCQAQGDAIHYASRRTHSPAPEAELRATYAPTGPVYRVTPGSLEAWLIERYCLYAADGQGRIYRGEIHHAPWPIQPAEAEWARNSVAQAAGIALPDTQPLLHFARRLDVVAWPIGRVTEGP
ncbi:MAG: DUF2071 domain-containing protein [Caldilineaceae bacterium]